MSRLFPLFGSTLGICGIYFGVKFCDWKRSNLVFAKSVSSLVDDALSLKLDDNDSWDNNWDKRQPESLVDPKLKLKDSSAYENKLKTSVSIANRNIILVRHGEELEGVLTPTGLKQAEITAKQIRIQNIPIEAIYYSANSFSQKTAEILRKDLPLAPISACELLSEGKPCSKSSEDELDHRTILQIHRDSVLFEAAFRKYVHRASPSQKSDSFEVIIAPNEMIRYFILRSLQLPVDSYEQFNVDHGSISWVTILPNGNVKIRRLNDIGHLPFVSKNTLV